MESGVQLSGSSITRTALSSAAVKPQSRRRSIIRAADGATDLTSASAHDGVRRHILCHHGAAADDGAVADGNARQDHSLIADPYVIAHHDIPVVIPGGGNVLTSWSTARKSLPPHAPCRLQRFAVSDGRPQGAYRFSRLSLRCPR